MLFFIAVTGAILQEGEWLFLIEVNNKDLFGTI
jgi:hypothetical protein